MLCTIYPPVLFQTQDKPQWHFSGRFVNICPEHHSWQENNILYHWRSTFVFPIEDCIHVNGQTCNHSCCPSFPDQKIRVQRSYTNCSRSPSKSRAKQERRGPSNCHVVGEEKKPPHLLKTCLQEIVNLGWYLLANLSLYKWINMSQWILLLTTFHWYLGFYIQTTVLSSTKRTFLLQINVFI